LRIAVAVESIRPDTTLLSHPYVDCLYALRLMSVLADFTPARCERFMTNTLREIALRVTMAVLCGLIALNAYLFLKNLKLIQRATTQRVEASAVQADISNVLRDLQDMETGQRGYLLTADPSYLTPYNEANRRLQAHFGDLRSRLAENASQDRSLEAALESLADSRIAEMDETIRLRELGYRHRAFQIVSSNRGKELMDQARTTLDALSSAQSRNAARYDREMRERMARAIKQFVFTSCLLLGVTVATLLAFDWYRKRLEAKCARHAESLQATSRQLEQFTSTVSHDVRALVRNMRGNANALLEVYGASCPARARTRPNALRVKQNR